MYGDRRQAQAEETSFSTKTRGQDSWPGGNLGFFFSDCYRFVDHSVYSYDFNSQMLWFHWLLCLKYVYMWKYFKDLFMSFYVISKWPNALSVLSGESPRVSLTSEVYYPN